MTPQLIKPVHTLHAYGDAVSILLGGSVTKGEFTMFHDVTPPGGGPPPHFHVREDEWWYVLEGQAEFYNGDTDTWTAVGAGGSVFMPRNSFHTFRNAGEGPLRQIIHTAPGGFETFFERSAAEFAKPGEPNFANLLSIAAENGIYFPTITPSDAEKRGTPELAPVIVKAGTGRTLRAFGEEITVLLDGAQTGGKVTAFVETTPPAGGPPLHFHQNEHEWFYILEGTVSFNVNGAWADAHVGDAVFAPRKSIHTFKNNTEQPTRMLIHASPSGFEKFFAEAAEEFARPSGPDMARAVAIAGAYGIHFVQE